MKKFNKIILWTARILGGLVFAFFIFMVAAHVIGGGESNSSGFSSIPEAISFYSMIVMVLGLGVALFKKFLGAIIALVGSLVFFSVRPDQFLNPWFLAIPVIALMFILVGLNKRKTQEN